MSSKTWPIVVGGIAVAGVAALVSVLAFGRDDRPDVERNEVVERWGPAALEREQARARAVAKMREAEQAALVAAEKAKLAAEEEKARQEARAKAIEAARTQGVLGAAALTQGGAFASLTGTGDFSSGFDDVDIQGGLLGGPWRDIDADIGFAHGRRRYRGLVPQHSGESHFSARRRRCSCGFRRRRAAAPSRPSAPGPPAPPCGP